MRRWLLGLYPRAWRRRYGVEYLALLEEVGLRPGTLLDCLRGALDAHLHPDLAPDAPPAPRPAEAGAAQPVHATAQPEPENAAPAPRRRLFASIRADGFESTIDQILTAAAERGAFDNLPGAGKPLELDDNPFAGEWAMAYRMLHAAGETLPWIALGREIDADEAALRAELSRTADRLRRLAADDPAARDAEHARARNRYLERAAQLDRKLIEHGALIPHARFDRGRLTPALAAARFDAACPPAG